MEPGHSNAEYSKIELKTIVHSKDKQTKEDKKKKAELNKALLIKYGSIYVKSSKDRYHAGEQFDGVINLNLIASYPGDTISIIIKNKEKCVYEQFQVGTKRYANQKEKKIFMNKKIPVYKNSSGEFKPGQYAFPISFLIPKDTPPTFYYERKDWEASSEFKIKVILETVDPAAPKLRSKENLIIREIRQLKTEPVQQQQTFRITRRWWGCCCSCGVGESKMTLKVDKGAYAPEENMDITFSVDNSRTKMEFDYGRAGLLERVWFGKDYESSGQSHERFIVSSDLLRGMEAKGSIPEQKVQLTLPPYIDPNNISTTDHGSKPCNAGRDPKDWDKMFLSVRGSLIKVEFYAYVLINRSYTREEESRLWRVDSKLPVQLEFPVEIYLPDSYQLPKHQDPDGWHPTVMPTANLSLDSGSGQHANQLNSKLQINDNVMKP